MAYERLIKRTVWVAKCEPCEWEVVYADNPPRERQCPKCREWKSFRENSAIGPDLVK